MAEKLKNMNIISKDTVRYFPHKIITKSEALTLLNLVFDAKLKSLNITNNTFEYEQYKTIFSQTIRQFQLEKKSRFIQRNEVLNLFWNIMKSL